MVHTSSTNYQISIIDTCSIWVPHLLYMYQLSSKSDKNWVLQTLGDQLLVVSSCWSCDSTSPTFPWLCFRASSHESENRGNKQLSGSQTKNKVWESAGAISAGAILISHHVSINHPITATTAPFDRLPHGTWFCCVVVSNSSYQKCSYELFFPFALFFSACERTPRHVKEP